jgi:TRAP-type mannitol/chloroaromatic compound transport system permease small subunit
MDPHAFLTLGAGLKLLGTLLLPLFALPLVALAFPGPLDALAKRVFGAIDRVTGAALGLAIASGLLLLFATLAVVLLRYAFGLSFTWLNEVMTYSFAAMFMLGSAAAMRDGAHVRVDILRPRFGETGRNWVELAGIYLFLFPICLRLVTTGEEGLARSWLLLEGSREPDGLPILYLFKTLVPVFAVLLMIQGLSEATKAALRITGALPPEAQHGGDDLAGGAHGA